jgi:hypothetical protein
MIFGSPRLDRPVADLHSVSFGCLTPMSLVAVLNKHPHDDEIRPEMRPCDQMMLRTHARSCRAFRKAIATPRRNKSQLGLNL